MVLRKSFYIRWSAERSPRVHEVNPGRDPSELARLVDDYVATDMAKVRKFEVGLKLSIRGKIVGLFQQDMDLMIRTTMAIERGVDDIRSIRDAGASDKRKQSQLSSSSSGKK